MTRDDFVSCKIQFIIFDDGFLLLAHFYTIIDVIRALSEGARIQWKISEIKCYAHFGIFWISYAIFLKLLRSEFGVLTFLYTFLSDQRRKTEINEENKNKLF